MFSTELYLTLHQKKFSNVEACLTYCWVFQSVTFLPDIIVAMLYEDIVTTGVYFPAQFLTSLNFLVDVLCALCCVSMAEGVSQTVRQELANV